MPTADQRTDAELMARCREELADLARDAVRVEVRLGEAHDTYPPTPDDDPLAVVDDPEMLAELFVVLATADPTGRSVAQILPGVSLTFIDADDDWAGSVDLLSPTWTGGFSYAAQLARPVLPQVLDQLGSAIWPEQLIEDYLVSSPPPTSPDGDLLAGLWRQRWSGPPRDAYFLRGISDRWVRFHSLPESKRYADDEAEYREVLRRHRVVLDELVSADGGSDRRVVVVTCTWSGTLLPVPRPAPVTAVLPSSRYWMSEIRDEDDEDGDVWTHNYVDVLELDDPRLDRLLTLVADDVTAGVMIAPPDLRWLYQPYDGGADVYAASAADRDALRDRHADWLSSHPHGL